MKLHKLKAIRHTLLPVFLGIVVAVLVTACGNFVASLPASAPTASSAPIDPLQAIRMVDTSNGWALTTKNAVLKTSDGGHHWQNVSPKTPLPGKYIEGDFLTMQVALLAWQAGPDQAITTLHTSDGGASWQAATINNITGGSAQGMLCFINTQQGWLATSEAEGMMQYTTNIYRTIDGGQTWTNISGPLRSTAISGISFASPQLGWAGLQWPGSTLHIEKIVNGGQSWQQLQLPTPDGFSTAQIGLTQTNAPVLIGASGLLPAHITISSPNAEQSRLVLYTTQNSGATWTANTVTNFDSNDVYALDTQHVWAEDIHSNALHFSSDGGKTWTQLVQTPSHFGALSIVDTDNGWAIDDAGHLYQTKNGGTSWQPLP